MASQAPSVAYLSEDRGPGYEAGVAVMVTTATITVLLRLISRKILGVTFWWDDFFIVIATVFAWALAASVFEGVAEGAGKHEAALPLRGWAVIATTAYFQELSYACCIPLIKISVLLFYRRIFPNRTFLVAIYILGCIIAAWSIAVVIVAINPCTLVYYYWDRTILNGHCINIDKFTAGAAITNSITDFAILVLPLPIFWNLQLKLRQKFALTAVFSVGVFVVVANCVRIKYVLAMSGSKDLWDAYTSSVLWTNAEPDIGIICACLPTLMPLAKYIREKLGGTALEPYSVRKTPGSLHVQWPSITTDMELCQPNPPRRGISIGFRRLADPVAVDSAFANTTCYGVHDAGVCQEIHNAGDFWPLGDIYVKRDLDMSIEPRMPV